MKAKKLALAMAIGDGHVDKRHFRFSIKHCEAQKEFLLWKATILQKLQKQPIHIARYWTRDSRLGNNGSWTWRLTTRKRPIYRIIRKWLYRNDRKTLTRKLLEKLTLEGIAIWFMDDGSSSFMKDRRGYIHSILTTLNVSLSREQCKIILDYFKDKWGIRWRIAKNGAYYVLTCNVEEGKKLAKLIEPYVIPSMRYKVDKLLSWKTRRPIGTKI